MQKIRLIATLGMAVSVAACSTLKTDEGKAKAVAIARANCANQGKQADILSVDIVPDGAGGMYVTINCRCVGPGEEGYMKPSPIWAE